MFQPAATTARSSPLTACGFPRDKGLEHTIDSHAFHAGAVHTLLGAVWGGSTDALLRFLVLRCHHGMVLPCHSQTRRQ